MNIILIEDELAIGQIYVDVIEGIDGASVAWFKDSLSTMDYVQSKNADLILMDLMLADTRGEDIIKSIRNLKQYENTPIVVLTNMGSGFDKEWLMEDMGVKQIYLKLEIGPDEIREIIHQYSA